MPRVNGAINVQPLRRLDPAANAIPGIEVELVDAQMRALYELGFAAVRITVTFSRFGENFLAAIPYVRAARALGIDVLALAVGLLRVRPHAGARPPRPPRRGAAGVRRDPGAAARARRRQRASWAGSPGRC